VSANWQSNGKAGISGVTDDRQVQLYVIRTVFGRFSGSPEVARRLVRKTGLPTDECPLFCNFADFHRAETPSLT